MARLPRYAIKNQPHHIIQRGRDGKQIFFEEQDYQYFYDCLEAAAYNYHLKIHAYVLMPNHVHILATPGDTDSISRTTQSIGRNYVQYFNEYFDMSGTLWEGRYRATVIDSKTYLLTCSRYIELNPVRGGLVKKPVDYRWSSYAHNALGKADAMISAHGEYLKLGNNDKERAKAYRALFKQKLSSQTVQTITETALKGWVLGDDKFARKIEKLSGRRASRLPKGRPRGS
ncbi:MAG: transposase [Gammaproteobacteria bacterium]|nr:transposase [Gammaproteobacteria bacterium]MDH3859449.1 transposase [Gammaproteobacteria bacterium]